MTLIDLKLTQQAKISTLPSDLQLTAKLMEQGFSLNSTIYLAHKAPFNGPLAFNLHDTKVCLSPNIAQLIGVEVI